VPGQSLSTYEGRIEDLGVLEQAETVEVFACEHAIHVIERDEYGTVAVCDPAARELRTLLALPRMFGLRAEADGVHARVADHRRG
jgi:hypothetical protein